MHPLVRLSWTEHSKPTRSCPYDHTIAETPFGRFLLTWKSWKEFPAESLGFDETPWGDVVYIAWSSVEDAKRWAEAEMVTRCQQFLMPNAAVETPRHMSNYFASGPGDFEPRTDPPSKDAADVSNALLGSHISIPVMIDGQRATITGDPDMPDETKRALSALVKAARRLTQDELDRIDESHV